MSRKTPGYTIVLSISVVVGGVGLSLGLAGGLAHVSAVVSAGVALAWISIGLDVWYWVWSGRDSRRKARQQ